MFTVLELMVAHSDDEIRKVACDFFKRATYDNKYVQQFLFYSAAINLTIQYEREASDQMKSCIQECVNCFLRYSQNANNFQGKRQYINEYRGLKQLSRLIADHRTT